jgi:hypothetical protein
MQTVFYRKQSSEIAATLGHRVMIGGYPKLSGEIGQYQAAIEIDGQTVKRDFTPQQFSFEAAEQWLSEVAACRRGFPGDPAAEVTGARNPKRMKGNRHGG